MPRDVKSVSVPLQKMTIIYPLSENHKQQDLYSLQKVFYEIFIHKKIITQILSQILYQKTKWRPYGRIGISN